MMHNITTQEFTIKGVTAEGAVEAEPTWQVPVDGAVMLSDGSHGLDKWFAVYIPRDVRSRTVSGVKIHFDSVPMMNDFLEVVQQDGPPPEGSETAVEYAQAMYAFLKGMLDERGVEHPSPH